MQTLIHRLAFTASLAILAAATAAPPVMAQQPERRQSTGDRDGSMQAQRTDPDAYANHPDYSNNDYYRTGNDEGYQDFKAKKRRAEHQHQYRTDEDRKAHDYGYEEGWSGRSYRDSGNNRSDQTSGADRTRDRDNQKHDKLDDRDAH